MGKSYSNLGNVYMGLGQFDTALDFYLKNLTIEMEVMHKLGERKACGNLIKVYEKLGQFDKVREFRHKYLKITRELEK